MVASSPRQVPRAASPHDTVMYLPGDGTPFTSFASKGGRDRPAVV